MELTQEQVNQIVDIADEYQIELDAAAKRFRRRLGEVGLAIGPAGRLVARERFYRPASLRITMEDGCGACGYLPPHHAPGCETDTDERGH